VTVRVEAVVYYRIVDPARLHRRRIAMCPRVVARSLLN
jgi:hypothetical protein